MLDKMSNEPRAAIFRGTVGKVSTVPSRGVVVVTVEMPIEEHELVARVASHGSWVAVARIQEPAKQETKEDEKKKKLWNELTPQAQAGILCNDPEFIEYLGAKDAEEAALSVRERCKVASRAELSTNSRAAREWLQIESGYRVWQAARS